MMRRGKALSIGFLEHQRSRSNPAQNHQVHARALSEHFRTSAISTAKFEPSAKFAPAANRRSARRIRARYPEIPLRRHRKQPEARPQRLTQRESARESRGSSCIYPNQGCQSRDDSIFVGSFFHSFGSIPKSNAGSASNRPGSESRRRFFSSARVLPGPAGPWSVIAAFEIDGRPHLPSSCSASHAFLRENHNLIHALQRRDTSARLLSLFRGRPSPFKPRTESSPLIATTSASPSDRAA